MSELAALSDRLAACYASVVHDVMRGMGLGDFTLPPRLRPLMPERRLAGPAFTILGETGAFDPHETLMAWTGLLSQCPADHVWCCQPMDDAVAHMGELSAETLQAKGVRGSVADGMIRDADFLLSIGFQAWGSGFTPRDVVGRWKPKATEVPITIGPVGIAPGDFLLGDRDGMVRIPRDRLTEVLEAAEAAMTAESAVRAAIRAGADPQRAYLEHGKF